MKLKKQLYGIYAKHTKQSLQVIGECPPPQAEPWLRSAILTNTHICDRPRAEPGPLDLGTVDTQG